MKKILMLLCLFTSLNGFAQKTTEKSKQPNKNFTVTISNNLIYKNGEVVGKYKQGPSLNMALAANVTQVRVYKNDDEKVVTAMHTNNDDLDWQLYIEDNGKKIELLYHSEKSLEKLFTYLILKGYL